MRQGIEDSERLFVPAPTLDPSTHPVVLVFYFLFLIENILKNIFYF